MKVGIIGLGKRLAYLARVFSAVDPGFRIVGYVDPEPFGLADAQAHGIAVGRHHDSLAKLLAAERLDLLMIGSPNHLHLEQLSIGLQHDMPIFCEKPVVISEEQTHALLRLLVDGADRRVLIGLVLRYTTLYEDMMTAIADGTIGEISSMEASEHINPGHGAFFMRDWRRYDGFSGGFMLEKCCHDLDIYRSMVGARALRVASFGGRRSFIPRLGNLENREIHHSKPAGWNSTAAVFDSDADIVDCQTAIVEYANGVPMTFHVNMNVPDEFRRFCIVGSHGMAEGDFVRNYLRIHQTPSGILLADQSRYQGSELGMHYGGEERMAAADIIRYIRGEGPLPVSVYDALESGLTAMKIDEARRTRSVIDLTETWRRFDETRLGAATPSAV